MREYEHLLKTILETCDYNNPNHRVRVYEFHENERMVFNKLEEMDLIKNVTHIGQRYIGFDLSYDAIHYFDENEEVINSNSNAFTYELPGDFKKRVIQILGQEVDACQVVLAFKRCKYEYEDDRLTYYAGVSGDN